MDTDYAKLWEHGAKPNFQWTSYYASPREVWEWTREMARVLAAQARAATDMDGLRAAMLDGEESAIAEAKVRFPECRWAGLIMKRARDAELFRTELSSHDHRNPEVMGWAVEQARQMDLEHGWPEKVFNEAKREGEIRFSGFEPLGSFLYIAMRERREEFASSAQ